MGGFSLTDSNDNGVTRSDCALRLLDPNSLNGINYLPRLTPRGLTMTSTLQADAATEPTTAPAEQPSASSTAPAPSTSAAPALAAAKAVAKRAPRAAAKKVAAPAKPAAKVAVKAVAKKATPKAAVKPVVRATPAVAPKLEVKTVAKAEPKASASTPAKQSETKLLKPKKPKLVRDSFTIPKLEYLKLEELKHRGVKLGTSVKKSELIRAGILALASMSDASFLKVTKAIPAIKTGRPAKD
jgi:pyruvate/2-oxoglutarate dehydrogenase complex dihydrolipoamide acyltransferase (E2) component